MSSEWKTIRIKTETDYKLKGMQGRSSLNDLIYSMARYFELTNYDPLALHKNPTLDFHKELSATTERTIKILKAFEKQYIKPSFEMLKSVTENGSLEIQNLENPNGENIQIPEGLTLEEIEAIIQRNAELEEENKDLTDRLEKVNKDYFLLQSTPNNTSPTNINVEVIQQSLEQILNSAKPNRLQQGISMIDESTLKGYITRIFEELKKASK